MGAPKGNNNAKGSHKSHKKSAHKVKTHKPRVSHKAIKANKTIIKQ